MRKILLLTFISGLGISLQTLSTVNVVAHSVGLEYLYSHCSRVCMAPSADIRRENALIVSKFAPLKLCAKIIVKKVPGSHLPATKVFRDKSFLRSPAISSSDLPVFIQQDISTTTTLHFNRMVNRKRILLSG